MKAWNLGSYDEAARLLESDTVTEDDVADALMWMTHGTAFVFWKPKDENAPMRTESRWLANGRKRQRQSASSPVALKAMSGLRATGKTEIDAAEAAGGWC